MIRIVLISAGFISVTIALVMMQPSSPRQMADEPVISETDPAVTRQETDFEALTQLRVAPERAKETSAAPAKTTAVTKPTPVAPRSTDDGNLETLILDALKQGQSEDYIGGLVNDAADKGKVELPDSLITDDGRVDTSALLATLSQPVKPEHHSHTVSPGDTLASISYRYHGRTEHGPAILAANPDVARLTVGQTLIIPKLQ
jgi:nucleoid-associated protein YgaU